MNAIYLNVPYAQKDIAKANGARWNPSVKKWYLPAGVAVAAALTPFLPAGFKPAAPKQAERPPVTCRTYWRNGRMYSYPTRRYCD